MKNFDKIFFTDIDNTLLGDDESLAKLKSELSAVKFNLGIAVASGRKYSSVKEVLEPKNFFPPDIIISSVGSEIYLRNSEADDYNKLAEWNKILSANWNRQKLVLVLSDLQDIKLQNKSEQHEHKLSYHITEKTNTNRIKERLQKLGINVKIIISKNKDLDILPANSGKGNAIEYILKKYNIPKNSIVISGDSGNDEEMLSLNAPSIVVSNYSNELEHLKSKNKIYFSRTSYAAGIIEGMKHFNFLDNKIAAKKLN